jgi:hypothetical protein
MSSRKDELQNTTPRLQHVLAVGMRVGGVDIAVATRSSRVSPLRVQSDFAIVPEIVMGRTPLTMSRAAERALGAAMQSARPLVVRSKLSSLDAMALVDEWELRVAMDSTPYQMADGRGKQSLATMWSSAMRLEHDLEDTTTPNPVMTWLRTSPPNSVGSRAWQLQQHIETVADSRGLILRRPAFATGLIAVGGGPTHFDDYNNTALVLAGNKSFFIAPPDAMKWEDGLRNGKQNERLNVDPFVPGPYPEPSLAKWLLADLGPGDMLYLPRSWWHFVVSEPHSVMTNVWTG